MSVDLTSVFRVTSKPLERSSTATRRASLTAFDRRGQPFV